MRFREPGFQLAMAALAAAALIAVVFIDRPLSELMKGLDPQVHAGAVIRRGRRKAHRDLRRKT